MADALLAEYLHVLMGDRTNHMTGMT